MNKKYYVIVNQDRKFVRRTDYDGMMRLEEKYSDDCAFTSINTAKRMAFALNAISELYHDGKYSFKILEHDNRVKEIDASVPDNQRESFGLPAKSEAPSPDAGPTVTE